jgi:hypothetical protein
LMLMAIPLSMCKRFSADTHCRFPAASMTSVVGSADLT